MADKQTARPATDRNAAAAAVASQKSLDDAARRDAARFREALAQADRASDREIDRSLRRA